MDNFKMDFLVLAFHDYLDQQDKHLGQKLKTLGTEAMPSANSRQENLDEILTDRAFTPNRLARPSIYLVLHLMPIEFINQLSLQIKKQHVLTGGEQFGEIAEAINLYLDMHDAGLSLQKLEDSDALKAFYEEAIQAEFDNRFKQNETDQALIPVRGLREILRFGNTSVLNRLFANNQVTQEELKEFEQLRNNIADYQSTRKDLHETISKNKKITVKMRLKCLKKILDKNIDIENLLTKKESINLLYQQVCIKNQRVNFTQDDKNIIYKLFNSLYSTINKQIVRYRELKNKIYLHNPKQAHQLMIAIIGRMISYAQLYERDIYFVMLAVFFLQGKKLEAKQDEAFAKLINKGQVITAIYNRVDKEGKSVVSDKIKEALDLLSQIFTIQENKTTRNDLAHINYLRSMAKNISVPDFTRMLNQVRRMMAYDRKLKNAVVKSLRELCERHNLIVNFRMDVHHQLQLQSIQAKTIYHLGTSTKSKLPICEKLHSQAFVSTLETLFSEENKNKTTARSQ